MFASDSAAAFDLSSAASSAAFAAYFEKAAAASGLLFAVASAASPAKLALTFPGSAASEIPPLIFPSLPAAYQKLHSFSPAKCYLALLSSSWWQTASTTCTRLSTLTMAYRG